MNRNGAVHLSLGDIAEIENDPVQALFYWSRYLDRCVPKPLHSHVPKVVPVCARERHGQGGGLHTVLAYHTVGRLRCTLSGAE